MKISYLIVSVILLPNLLIAQEGKILSKDVYTLHDTSMARILALDKTMDATLKKIDIFRITYLSDGLKVKGFLLEPKLPGKYPCIISNRGGNREFGKWSDLLIGYLLGRMASWDYVVIATQYRGVDGGEGSEEFGGKEVNDILNLVKSLGEVSKADTSRIGIEGTSRGGMMTYLALKKTCVFKAAAVTAGAANAFANMKKRPEMESNVYAQLIPDYAKNKERELIARSAVFWAGELCKSTPLLIMQGSADWRVLPEESMELVQKLYENKHPVRFVLYEGADHSIREFRPERFAEMKRHFDYYVRDKNKLPDLNPHGP